MRIFSTIAAALAAAWLSFAHVAPASAQSFSCAPGDRAVCHWQGACSAQGDACVCSDPAHYDAREQCATWKQAVVPDGKSCLPGDRSYCSFNGVCNDAGSACVCDDKAHYAPADQCKVWQQSVLSGAQQCAPGDRTYCNGHGACNADGSACVCDDPLSYSPSDRCQNFHNDIVPPGKLCKPGTREYCSGNGTCTADGNACKCDSWWWNGAKCATPADQCPGYGPQPDGSFSQRVCDGRACLAPGQCEPQCNSATLVASNYGTRPQWTTGGRLYGPAPDCCGTSSTPGNLMNAGIVLQAAREYCAANNRPLTSYNATGSEYGYPTARRLDVKCCTP